MYEGQDKGWGTEMDLKTRGLSKTKRTREPNEVSTVGSTGNDFSGNGERESKEKESMREQNDSLTEIMGGFSRESYIFKH